MRTLRQQLKTKKRIVLKVGSSILVDAQGRLCSIRCRALAAEIAELIQQKRQVILVSSGAIAAGLDRLKRQHKPKKISILQAIAAAGQTALMHEYEKAFSKHGLQTAQILLTRDDLADRRRFLNARHTIHELLKMGLVPIINENDTVAIDEIKVGDNDNLSALVTSICEADLLIILSDVDGVYDSDPRLNPNAHRLSLIRRISSKLKKGATDTSRLGSTGGMRTKLEAAAKAQAFGVPTMIAQGAQKDILQKIMSGADEGTLISPINRNVRLSSKKHWMAYTLKPKGKLYVDTGARQALVEKGRSLLASGVQKVEGSFHKGDPIDLQELGSNQPFARGLSSYHASDLEKIKGLKSAEIPNILGHEIFDEVIHRNDLVLL